MTMQSLQGQKRNLSFYVDREIVDRVDNFRGEVPRSKVMQKALNQFLERELAARALGVRSKNEK
jgi:hypothetical protein